MRDNMEIGKNIANYRAQKRLTQTELASAIGVSKGHLAAIEEGRRVPGIKILARIADALRVTIEELLMQEH